MSKLRPEMLPARASSNCPRGLTAYVAIYNSVKGQTYGLIHGQLHDARGHHCAIGSFFNAVDRDSALPDDVIDEVATVNDSCKSFTPKQRRNSVLQWLRWKLHAMGYRMPGRRPVKR